MPLLQTYKLTPCYGYEQVESDIQAALGELLDNASPPQKLFVVTDIGFDAEIADAIMATPPVDLMPLARVAVFAENETLAMGGGQVWSKSLASIYIFYYYGVPSTAPSYSSFVKLRRQHLTAVLRCLQFQQPGINYGIPQTSRRWWKPNSEIPVTVDLVSPFRYIDRTYNPNDTPGVNCVRIDWPIFVKLAQ